MHDISQRNFGTITAYLIPGCICLWGISFHSATVQAWLGMTPSESPTVAGFLFVTVAALAAGYVASLLRWMAIDTLLHRTGVPHPQGWDYSRLQQCVTAYELLGYHHYYYYKASANAFIATAFAYAINRWRSGQASFGLFWTDLAFAAVSLLLFAGSRDALRKYYAGVSALLSSGSSSAISKTPRTCASPPEHAQIVLQQMGD